MLNEISGDLRQRVQHIKVVLGEEDDDEVMESVTPGPSDITADENALLLANVVAAPSGRRVTIKLKIKNFL